MSFGGVLALKNVSIEVQKGKLTCIIGPNGAGKTTLINCINGIYKYTGQIYFKGKALSNLRPYEIARLGIARTFQNIELFKNATVLQNLLVGRFMRRKTNLLSETLFLPAVFQQEREDRRKVEEIIDLLKIDAYREQLVSNIPYGILKLCEVGRAIATEPELLILDEPTSGLNPDEAEDLMWWITDIKEDMGIQIVMIEHNLDVVMKISDVVCVLDAGSLIAMGDPNQIRDDPRVQEAYFG